MVMGHDIDYARLPEHIRDGVRDYKARQRYIDGGSLDDLREALDLAAKDYAADLQ